MTLSQGYREADVRRHVLPRIVAFNSCYRHTRQAQAPPPYRVSARIVVGDFGTSGYATGSAPTPVKNCVENMLLRDGIGPPPNGPPATVTFLIHLGTR
jgi:hypothetical protein